MTTLALAWLACKFNKKYEELYMGTIVIDLVAIVCYTIIAYHKGA